VSPQAWPFKLAFQFLKRLSRKILYFLTVKEATDQLSFYWHRAFLLDYMIGRGDLADGAVSARAVEALSRTLDQPDISPLTQLAQRTVGGASHIFGTLRRARGGKEDEVVAETRSRMARNWEGFSDYFEALTAEFEEIYQGMLAAGTGEGETATN
jgi:hypothetical protein